MNRFLCWILIYICVNKNIRSILKENKLIFNSILEHFNWIDFFISITRILSLKYFKYYFKSNNVYKPICISNRKFLSRNIYVKKCSLKIQSVISSLVRDNYKLSKIYITQSETIPAECFINNINLKKVFVSKHTKYIKKNAFKNCISLTKIYLPKTLEYIEENAFNNCINLTSVYFY